MGRGGEDSCQRNEPCRAAPNAKKRQLQSRAIVRSKALFRETTASLPLLPVTIPSISCSDTASKGNLHYTMGSCSVSPSSHKNTHGLQRLLHHQYTKHQLGERTHSTKPQTHVLHPTTQHGRRRRLLTCSELRLESHYRTPPPSMVTSEPFA